MPQGGFYQLKIGMEIHFVKKASIFCCGLANGQGRLLPARPSGAGALRTGKYCSEQVLCHPFDRLGQRIIKIEAEMAGIFADDRSGENIENVIAGLLRKLDLLH